MIGSWYIVEVDIFSRGLQMTPYNLSLQSHSKAHFHDEHRDFFCATASRLNDASSVNFAFKIFLPCNLLADPGEDCS